MAVQWRGVCLCVVVVACSAQQPVDTDIATVGDTDALEDFRWAHVASGSWSAVADQPCDLVQGTLVSTPNDRDAWLEGFVEQPIDEVDRPEVDWAESSLLLAVVECRSTGKTLTITDVREEPTQLRVDVELRHPGIDGAIETTFWSAAEVSDAEPGWDVVFELVEVFDPPPQ